MQPELPPLAPRLEHLASSVYSQLVSQLGAHKGKTYPLHVGDTWLAPPAGTSPAEQTDIGPANTYTPVAGLPGLTAALAQRVGERTGVPVGEGELFVGAGATACLSSVVGALVNVGDEAMVLAPAWPLFAGMVKAWGGTPRWVPFLVREGGTGVPAPQEVAAILDAYVGPRTRLLYVNTPNNPTGLVLPRPVLQAIVDWARARGIWLVSDEVYEDFCYAGEHVYLRSLAPERTISAWSFSKGFGMSGYRVGYVAGPRTAIAGAKKLATHGWYCAPRPGQEAALHALGPAGDAWVRDAREAYAALGAWAAERLGVQAPAGSTFLFVDLAQHLGEGGMHGFLSGCVQQGLLISPGGGFGPYPTHARVCFTSTTPDRVRAGVDVLAQAMGR